MLGANREVVDRLLAAGFRQDVDQMLFLPLLLDVQALATGFESNDLGAAMQPVRDALRVIVGARADLDALVQADRETG